MWRCVFPGLIVLHEPRRIHHPELTSPTHPAPISATVANGKPVFGTGAAGAAVALRVGTSPDDESNEQEFRAGQTGQVAGTCTPGQDTAAVLDSCAASFAGTMANSENPGDREE